MQIPSKVVFQNSIVASTASVFTISLIRRLQTYIALSYLKVVHCPEQQVRPAYFPMKTDFSQVPFLQSILLLQLGATPPLMMYSNSSFFQFPFLKY